MPDAGGPCRPTENLGFDCFFFKLFSYASHQRTQLMTVTNRAATENLGFDCFFYFSLVPPTSAHS